jgi:hypothetical protein
MAIIVGFAIDARGNKWSNDGSADTATSGTTIADTGQSNDASDAPAAPPHSADETTVATIAPGAPIHAEDVPSGPPSTTAVTPTVIVTRIETRTLYVTRYVDENGDPVDSGSIANDQTPSGQLGSATDVGAPDGSVSNDSGTQPRPGDSRGSGNSSGSNPANPISTRATTATTRSNVTGGSTTPAAPATAAPVTAATTATTRATTTTRPTTTTRAATTVPACSGSKC